MNSEQEKKFCSCSRFTGLTWFKKAEKRSEGKTAQVNIKKPYLLDGKPVIKFIAGYLKF